MSIPQRKKESEKGFVITRKDVILPKNRKKVEDLLIKMINEADCYVKFDLLGSFVLVDFGLKMKEQGKAEAEKCFKEDEIEFLNKILGGHSYMDKETISLIEVRIKELSKSLEGEKNDNAN